MSPYLLSIRNELIIEISGRRYPKTLDSIGNVINVPDLPALVADYLREVVPPDSPEMDDSFFAPDQRKHVYIYHSASITFHDPYTPSTSDTNIRREHVRATPSWRGGSPRYDCIFISTDSTTPGVQGLLVGRLKLLFSFHFEYTQHSCALVDWFSIHGDRPDEDTGMWVVTPDTTPLGDRLRGVIPLDSIVRGAHLIPVFGPNFLHPRFNSDHTLDAFSAYFVNKFADHHSHTLAF